MKEPERVSTDVVLAIQEMQLAEHGGSLGIRDRGSNRGVQHLDRRAVCRLVSSERCHEARPKD